MKIYDYTCYKKYINEYIKAMPKSGRGQFLQLSKALQCHSTLISQIFNGERELNLEQALRLCDHYGFEHRERRFFLTMVEFSRAGDFKLRQHFSGELKVQREEALDLENRLKVKTTLEPHEKARFYSDAIYSIVRLATTLEGVSDTKTLASHLGIEEDKANEILDFLISTGLVIHDEEGLKIGKKTHVPKSDPLVLNHHRNWRLQGISAQARKKQEDLFYTGPMVISKKDFEVVKDKVGSFLEDFYKVVGPSECEELYCLNIDLFEAKP